MITLEHITKRFSQTVAVDDVSMTIKSGERFVILGPSGSGKTTILRLIAGFEEPDIGKVVISGTVVSDPEIKVPPRKRNIGMVFQDLALWPHMTVVQNVGFGLEIDIKDRHEREVVIMVMLKSIGLDTKGGAYPNQLSGGEQQRVALARALIHKPKILLMDEPLANLDSELKSEMVDLILSLQDKDDFTLVYVTHDEQVAGRLATSTAKMIQGRLTEMKSTGKDE
jgi:ABC-type Fe3+/spermidine/putrescine transport system ATPase subunit